MNICVVTPYFFPHVGGSQQYILNLYSHLRAIDPTLRVDIICYNTDNAKKYEMIDGLHIHRINCLEILRGQFSLPNYFELIALLQDLKKKHGRYGVLNAHTRFFDTAWWGWLAARYLGAHSVLTDHCASHPQHQSRLVRKISEIVDFCVSPLLRQYDSVTAVSKATSEFLEELRVETDAVIYGGVETKKFHSKQSGAIRKVPRFMGKFAPDDILISFVGRLIPSKGSLFALESLQKILAKYPNAHLFLAGEGELRPQVEAAENMQIHFLGQLDSTEVALLLSVTDIFIHPSTHHEGLPITLLEAAASGCSIVALPQGGTSEIIQDKKTGIFTHKDARFARSVEMLIKNKDLRNELGKNARQLVKQKFEWSKIAKQYLNFLRSR